MIHKIYLSNDINEEIILDVIVNEFGDIDENSMSKNNNLIKFLMDTLLYSKGHFSFLLKLESGKIFDKKEYSIKEITISSLIPSVTSAHFIYNFFEDYISNIITQRKVAKLYLSNNKLELARKIKINGDEAWINLMQ